MKNETTTIRITKESHEKLSSFMQEYGLKICPTVSRALLHLVTRQPEVFFPHSHNKSYRGDNRE